MAAAPSPRACARTVPIFFTPPLLLPADRSGEVCEGKFDKVSVMLREEYDMDKARTHSHAKAPKRKAVYVARECTVGQAYMDLMREHVHARQQPDNKMACLLPSSQPCCAQLFSMLFNWAAAAPTARPSLNCLA
eukprot:6200478-Pleurochrysis_carterae.AAC.1